MWLIGMRKRRRGEGAVRVIPSKRGWGWLREICLYDKGAMYMCIGVVLREYLRGLSRSGYSEARMERTR